MVSWQQTVNIGDISHTPGLIHLLYIFLPGVRNTLCPPEIEHEEEQMVRKNFPSLRILYSGFNQQRWPENVEIRKAMDQADLMLHRFGPGIIGFDIYRRVENCTPQALCYFLCNCGEIFSPEDGISKSTQHVKPLCEKLGLYTVASAKECVESKETFVSLVVSVDFRVFQCQKI